MGAGKTAVLAEASDLLSERNIIHAAIDLDGLALAHLGSSANNDNVMYSNLRSVCSNYASLGVKRVLLARAVESIDELKTCKRAVFASETIVCRLTASIEAMQQRVKLRESGVLWRKYVDRVARLNDILDRAHLEDFSVTNENRALTDVAQQVLLEAGWISN